LELQSQSASIHTQTFRLQHAGPLMCAGLTVFTALRSYLDTKSKKQQRVAIVGIGGLGHIGLQFANKMYVVVLHTPSFLVLIQFLGELMLLPCLPRHPKNRRPSPWELTLFLTRPTLKTLRRLPFVVFISYMTLTSSFFRLRDRSI